MSSPGVALTWRALSPFPRGATSILPLGRIELGPNGGGILLHKVHPREQLAKGDCARKDTRRTTARDFFRKRLALALSPEEEQVLSGRLTGLIL